MLVGCGAAGAIAAAFGAPLTGAFYAFELVIGSYTIANWRPSWRPPSRARSSREHWAGQAQAL